MAVEEYLRIIRQGTAVWNKWRENNPALEEWPDLRWATKLSWAKLSGANLSKVDLRGTNLRYAKLSGANLSEANLSGAKLSSQWADLSKANLSGAYLIGADLSKANLSEANLRSANLSEANLSDTNLIGSDLSGANLNGTQFIRTDICHAELTGSSIYGISAWDVKLDAATHQENLIITPPGEPIIMVDNIKVAQFIYLLLNNEEIRDVIDTISSKAVLILGRFTDDRKPILDAVRDELRKPQHNYLPIVFDFEPSKNQTTIETIKILANMARFVIADLTDARSVLQELQAIVPNYPSVAVRLLLQRSALEYGMLDYFRRYRSVVENTYEYENLEEVVASIQENIIFPAEAKVKELRTLN